MATRVRCVHRIKYGDNPKQPQYGNPGQVITLPDEDAASLLKAGRVTLEDSNLPPNVQAEGKLGKPVKGKSFEEGQDDSAVTLPKGSLLDPKADEDEDDDEDDDDEDEDDDDDEVVVEPSKPSPKKGKK